MVVRGTKQKNILKGGAAAFLAFRPLLARFGSGLRAGLRVRVVRVIGSA